MALTVRYTILSFQKELNINATKVHEDYRKVKQEGGHVYYSTEDIQFLCIQSRFKYVRVCRLILVLFL